MNHYDVGDAGGLKGYIAGSNIGEHSFDVAFPGRTESASAAHFDEIAIAGFRVQRSNLTSWKPLHRPVGANNADAIRECLPAAVRTPGWTQGSFNPRLNPPGPGQAHVLADPQPAAKRTGSARILAQRAMHDQHRRFGFRGFDGCIVRITVIDTERRVLAIGVADRAPATSG